MKDAFDTEGWIEDFLNELLDLTALDVSIDELALDDEDVLHVELGGPDSARVIGREGQVLDALQHIVAAAAIHAGAPRQRILIDVEGYRVRRENRVRDEAIRLAAEVLDTGRSVEFSPMSPRERRLVHLTVAEIDGVTSESFGQGDERFVRILPRS